MLSSIALFVSVTAIAYLATIVYRLPEPKGDPRVELFSIVSVDRFLRSLIFGCSFGLWFLHGKSIFEMPASMVLVGIMAIAYWPFIIYVWVRPNRSLVGHAETI